MLRSLFAGVSGLINHQTKLDVIGNNISNVNTIGYKAADVSFKELLSQTVRGASRPSAGVGGTNAIQVGLGMSVASVNTRHTQGNLQSTGNAYDFALQGEGFFVIGMGEQVFYSRAGAFGLDGIGHLVHQSSGGILKGYLPGEDGIIRDSTPLQDIIIDKAQVVPAQATSYIGIAGNLKADSEALPTITNSGKFIKLADASATLVSLSQQEEGTDLGVRAGDVVTITGSIGGTNVSPFPNNLVVTDGTTLQDVLDFINASLTNAEPTYPAGAVTITNGVITVQGHGSQDITDLRLMIGGNPSFNAAFSFPSIINAGTSGDMSQTILTAAEETDLMIDLFNQDGEPLDGPASEYNIDGMTLALQAYVGGETTTPTFFTVNGTTTLGDLMLALDNAIDITNIGTAGVSLTEDGEIRVEGNAGLEHEIDSLSISDASATIALGNTFQFTEIQAAKDSDIHTVSLDVFDSLGSQHHLTLTFRKEDTSTEAIEWYWEAATEETSTLLSGDRGRLTFSPTGELVSFSFEDGTGAISIDPGNGAETLMIGIQTEVGSSTLTQTAGDSTAKVIASDGYTAGSLESTYVDETGTIVGQFSNGVSRVMAQIAVAKFSNSGGLIRSGNNLFGESANSGRALTGTIRGSAVNRITPGALEMSNVDLAQQFTQMITAQRGFQANARTITTGDEMLMELVNLKR
ncbi:MAG: flagellar hook-basal body complex protein [Candidatus Krumholzibacteriota bacterium]|nr:flagellar hook-basal body complex protein [Candidatus Krumholzibacteriota bacterium]